MAKKKTYRQKSSSQKVEESSVSYNNREIKKFKSFEEQEEYELQQMALLTPEQVLQQLRKFINIAYGMHGYDPKKLPKKHDIKIITVRAKLTSGM